MITYNPFSWATHPFKSTLGQKFNAAKCILEGLLINDDNESSPGLFDYLTGFIPYLFLRALCKAVEIKSQPVSVFLTLLLVLLNVPLFTLRMLFIVAMLIIATPVVLFTHAVFVLRFSASHRRAEYLLTLCANEHLDKNAIRNLLAQEVDFTLTNSHGETCVGLLLKKAERGLLIELFEKDAPFTLPEKSQFFLQLMDEAVLKYREFTDEELNIVKKLFQQDVPLPNDVEPIRFVVLRNQVKTSDLRLSASLLEQVKKMIKTMSVFEGYTLNILDMAIQLDDVELGIWLIDYFKNNIGYISRLGKKEGKVLERLIFQLSTTEKEQRTPKDFVPILPENLQKNLFTFMCAARVQRHQETTQKKIEEHSTIEKQASQPNLKSGFYLPKGVQNIIADNIIQSALPGLF